MLELLVGTGHSRLGGRQVPLRKGEGKCSKPASSARPWRSREGTGQGSRLEETRKLLPLQGWPQL